jgi:alpha-tubulin suppressor-like RCC1 family protein
LALLADGRVFAWGYNYYGELGNNSTTDSTTPVQVSGLTNAIAIAAGGYHSLAVLADGTVRCWGDNSQGGQSGAGASGGIYSLPTPPAGTGVTNAIGVAAGIFHSLVLNGDGTMWAWGLNDGSQLGNGTGSTCYCTNHPCTGQDSFTSPTRVQNMTNAAAIAAGWNQSLAVGKDGSLWVWGYNPGGELGTGLLNDEYPAPIQLQNLSNMVSVAGSINNSLATDAQGNVYVWGFDGFTNQPLIPTRIDNLPPIKAVAQGSYHGLGIAPEGSVYVWGDNHYWQFGDDTYTATAGGLSARYRTGPYPTAQSGQLSRGNLDTPDFTSFVIPLTQQRGVRLDATGSDAYKFGLMTPWINRLQKTTRNQVAGLTNGTQVVRVAVENPIAAFGSEVGVTPIYPGPSYSFGVYAGGLDESNAACTNTFRILVYSRDQFAGATNGIVPIATNIVTIPRRTISTDAVAWSNFVQNAWTSTNSAYGLNTTVEFVYGGAWGFSWQGGALANFQLVGYKVTHSATATATNYHFVIEGLGSVPTGSSTRTNFAVNASGQWVPIPLYTLDFEFHPPLRALFVDQPQFDGVPLPPTYAGKAADDLALAAPITNSIWLTNNAAYTNLDTSPELRQHPALDKLVADLNADPLRLTSFVVNEIGLVDPIGVGGTDAPNLIKVNQGGVCRSALGTLLERQGSPAEQCGLPASQGGLSGRVRLANKQ